MWSCDQSCHVAGRLGTVSLFPQNLVHIKYPFLKLWYENCYHKVRQLLQNETETVIKKLLQSDGSLMQSTSCIAKYVWYYKVRQIFQSEM